MKEHFYGTITDDVIDGWSARRSGRQAFAFVELVDGFCAIPESLAHMPSERGGCARDAQARQRLPQR
jgi:hypothetical protein